MKVSVIVPVWNREGIIGQTLDSIFCQTRRPDELIIVDNNSTDKTFQAVETWISGHQGNDMSVKLLKEVTPGACFARQKGLEASSGDYLIFFDSDDRMRPDLVSKASEAAEENPGADIICWKCLIHQLDDTVRIPPFLMNDPVEAHLIHTLLRPQGYMVAKNFLIKAGGWKKPIRYWNDLELGLRLILNTPKIFYINEILAEIYAQEVSITGCDFSSRQGEWELTLDEMEKVNKESDFPVKARIGKIIDYRRAILAAYYCREGNQDGAVGLMEKTLAGRSWYDKMVLKFSFEFTRRSLRGAWRIVRFMV